MKPRRSAVGVFVATAYLIVTLTLPLKAQTQPEMTAQAEADFEKADKELNAVYQKVMKSAEDDVARKKLAAAQKAWIRFRDAQAEFDADEFRGGTMAPQIYAISETETTDERIASLKRTLADQQSK